MAPVVMTSAAPRTATVRVTIVSDAGTGLGVVVELVMARPTLRLTTNCHPHVAASCCPGRRCAHRPRLSFLGFAYRTSSVGMRVITKRSRLQIATPPTDSGFTNHRDRERGRAAGKPPTGRPWFPLVAQSRVRRFDGATSLMTGPKPELIATRLQRGSAGATMAHGSVPPMRHHERRWHEVLRGMRITAGRAAAGPGGGGGGARAVPRRGRIPPPLGVTRYRGRGRVPGALPPNRRRTRAAVRRC